MSKEKPEVGDVFYDSQFEMRFIITSIKYDCYFGIWETGIGYSWQSIEFLDGSEYLGKSKVSLKELFDIKEK